MGNEPVGQRSCDHSVRDFYNTKRPHQGRNMNGMTPLKAFKKGLSARPKEKTAARKKKAA